MKDLVRETTPTPPQEGKNSPPAEGAGGGLKEERVSIEEIEGGLVSAKRAETNRHTHNYKTLPYNPNLKQRSRELRKAGILSEILFWNQVKNKQFKNLDFDRQKIIGNYIVDFYCASCKVVIEIDGISHDDKQEYDAERDEFMKGLGLEVIRIADIDVKRDIKGVMMMLYGHSTFDTLEKNNKQSNKPKLMKIN
jgi:very-short-patch-repair endonuclease